MAKKQAAVAVEPPVNEGARVREPQIEWINKGGKFLTADKRVIQRNQKFFAPVSQIPLAFRDVIKPVNPLPKEEEEYLTPVTGEYKIQRNDKNGLFDIVDPQGKVVNEKSLTEEAAKDLLSKLN